TAEKNVVGGTSLALMAGSFACGRNEEPAPGGGVLPGASPPGCCTAGGALSPRLRRPIKSPRIRNGVRPPQPTRGDAREGRTRSRSVPLPGPSPHAPSLAIFFHGAACHDRPKRKPKSV